MEEKHATDSIASVTIKPEYAPSEYCSSEAPPAYHKPKSATVQVAKIIATTFVVCSFILGVFILASAYIAASASCRELEQDLELLNKVSESFGPDCNNNNNNNNVPQPEALLLRDGDDSKSTLKRQVESVPKKSTKEAENNDEEDSDEHRIEFPLHIDFDEIAGNLVAKNQRSKMNCIVEKKKAEEVVDHQPKTVRLPFGVNLTTDPRFERLTGERMVIICESGNIQSSAQPQPERTHNGLEDNNNDQNEDDDDDDQQDTIMIQPVMIPIPQTAFHTHMPQQQMPPNPSNMQEMNVIRRPYHPMEVMRPPPSPMMMINQFRPPMEPPMMRESPSMRPSIMEARPTIQRIISFRQNIQPQIPQALDHQQQQQQQNSEEIEQERPKMMFIPQQVQIRVEAAEQSEPQQQQQQQITPNPIIQHIIQQIIAQKIMESQKAMMEENNRQQQQIPLEEPERAQIMPVPQRPLPILRPVHQNSPIPEEILTQLNRLPSNKEGVIFAVPTNEDESTNSSEEDDASSSSSSSSSDDETNINNNNNDQSQENFAQTADNSNNNNNNKREQQPSTNPSEQSAPNPEMMVNNRQTFIRRLPVDIPVNMMQLPSSAVPSSPQEQEVEISEETRPHYVQPRSV